MSALKIVFIAGERQIVLYGQGMKQMWQVESHVLERLGEEERLRLETAKFMKYWIDEEGDRVEIINDVDYDFFLKRMGAQRTPKIYFQAIYPSTESQAERAEPSSASPPHAAGKNLSVHRTVSCDACNAVPVRGYRYKCLQCPNYDLCMQCESQMKHPEHIMLRIPSADSTYEAICPTRFGNRRRDRKCAAALAAAVAATSDEGQGEGKSRHHRHHRRHCGNGGAGIWSNFYDMMQDLAEGGTAQQESATTESPQKQQQQPTSSTPPQPVPSAPAQEPQATSTQTGEATAAGNSQSKETNTSPDRSSNFFAGAQDCPRSSTSAPPSFENLQNIIDPNFMKAGIQILNNFSEMFGKILDPVATGNASRADSEPTVIDIDLITGKSGSSASTTPPPTSARNSNDTADSKKTSTAASGIVTPMETEITPSPSTSIPEVVLSSSPNSRGEDNDWTMIDNNVAAAVADAKTSAAAAAAAVAAASRQLDFAKLSQQLQSHIENEKISMISQDSSISASAPVSIPTPAPVLIPTPTPVSTPIPAPVSIPEPATAPVRESNPIPNPAPTLATAPPPSGVSPPPTPECNERRAVAVFHADPRINTAVHAMMSMGFSNEGAMLTQLLESVNGNIPLALDLMTAAQRN